MGTKQRARVPARWVALLRGINVGGKHRVQMAKLVDVFRGVGCSEVTTYIQSGNVVFRAGGARRGALADRLAAALTAGLGFAVPVVIRGADDLARVVREQPFGAAEPGSLHIAFLAATPSAAAVAALDPERSPPDAFAVRGDHVYLHLPNGVARTKLGSSYLDRTLATVSTLRNWRTVVELAHLAAGETSGAKAGSARPRGRAVSERRDAARLRAGYDSR